MTFRKIEKTNMILPHGRGKKAFGYRRKRGGRDRRNSRNPIRELRFTLLRGKAFAALVVWKKGKAYDISFDKRRKEKKKF